MLTLEALRDGKVVAAASVLLSEPGDTIHDLRISGATFDTVRLFSSGASVNGAWFGIVDNVRMVPAG